jgi:hypothetical protein
MTELQVGHRLASVDEFEAAPPGTVIVFEGAADRDGYTKQFDGTWLFTNGETYRPDQFVMGRNVIQTLPDIPILGSPLVGEAQFDALPIGSVFSRPAQHSTVWEKVGHRRWRSSATGDVRNQERFNKTGAYMLRAYGDRDSGVNNMLNVGDTLWYPYEFNDLPIGAVIRQRGYEDSDRYDWVKESGTQFRQGVHGATQYTNQFSNGYMYVVSLPEGHTPLPGRRVETLSQFQGRYVWSLEAITSATGTGNGDFQRAKRDLGLRDRYGPAVGMPVLCDMLNYGQYVHLPVGTLVAVGTPDLSLERFGVFRKTSSTWVHVFGENSRMSSGRLTIYQLPPGEYDSGWFDAPPVENDEHLLRVFMSDAWKIGRRAKNTHAWCGEFERYYSMVGLTGSSEISETRDWTTPGNDPRGIPAEEVARYPVGSLFLYDNGSSRFALYRRVANARNSAGTVRVMSSEGWADPGNMARRMVPVWRNNNHPLVEGRVMILSREWMEAAPVGSIVCQPTSLTNRYTKHADGMWVTTDRVNAYRHPAGDFHGHPGNWMWEQIGEEIR